MFFDVNQLAGLVPDTPESPDAAVLVPPRLDMTANASPRIVGNKRSKPDLAPSFAGVNGPHTVRSSSLTVAEHRALGAHHGELALKFFRAGDSATGDVHFAKSDHHFSLAKRLEQVEHENRQTYGFPDYTNSPDWVSQLRDVTPVPPDAYGSQITKNQLNDLSSPVLLQPRDHFAESAARGYVYNVDPGGPGLLPPPVCTSPLGNMVVNGETDLDRDDMELDDAYLPQHPVMNWRQISEENAKAARRE